MSDKSPVDMKTWWEKAGGKAGEELSARAKGKLLTSGGHELASNGKTQYMIEAGVGNGVRRFGPFSTMRAAETLLPAIAQKEVVTSAVIVTVEHWEGQTEEVREDADPGVPPTLKPDSIMDWPQ